MVDSTQYKEKNQLNLQSELEIPKIRCKIHQDYFIECISLDTDSKDLLFCLACFVDNGRILNGNKLVLLKQLFSQNSQEIIKNWPPLQNQKICEMLKSKEIQDYNRDEQIQTIQEEFSQTRKDLLRFLDDLEENIIAHINKIEDFRQDLFAIYNQISEKEEFKRQFRNGKNNQEELIDYLRKVIIDKQNYSQQNEQKIQESLDNVIKSQQQLSINHIATTIQQQLQTLKQIDFLNPISQNIISNNDQINQEQLNSNPEIRSQLKNESQRQLSEIQLQQNQIQPQQKENQSQYYSYLQETIYVRKSSQNDQMRLNSVPQIKKQLEQQVERQQPNQKQPTQDIETIDDYKNLSKYKSHKRIIMRFSQKGIGIQEVQILQEGLKSLPQLTYLELDLLQFGLI